MKAMHDGVYINVRSRDVKIKGVKLKASLSFRRTSEGSREGKGWCTHQPTQAEGICWRFLACRNARDGNSASFEPPRGGCTRCMSGCMRACLDVFPQKENNRKYFVAYFIARGNDPDLSMCVCVCVCV